MSLRVQSYEGGVQVNFNEELLDVTNNLENFSKDINSMLDEFNLKDEVKEQVEIKSCYTGSPRGPIVDIKPDEIDPENIRSISVYKNSRYLTLMYDIRNNMVTGVGEHNFPKAYSGCVNDWLPYSIMEGLRNAQKRNTLRWMRER